MLSSIRSARASNQNKFSFIASTIRKKLMKAYS